MNTEVHMIEGCEILGEASGRIGDYSQKAALFVGVYQKVGELLSKVSVYGMIDEDNKWNAPHSRFTSSGGGSPEILQHLRHIFYRHQKDNKNKVMFLDENCNRLIMYLALSGDIIIGVEDPGGEYGAVASFIESHPVYKDLYLLTKLIDEENIKNPSRNPMCYSSICKHLESVSLFP